MCCSGRGSRGGSWVGRSARSALGVSLGCSAQGIRAPSIHVRRNDGPAPLLSSELRGHPPSPESWVSVRERAAGVLWAAASQGHDGRLGASSGNEVDRCTPNVRHAAATLVLAAAANKPPVAGPLQTSKTYRTRNCREHSETDQRNLRGDAGGYLGPAPRAS